MISLFWPGNHFGVKGLQKEKSGTLLFYTFRERASEPSPETLTACFYRLWGLRYTYLQNTPLAFIWVMKTEGKRRRYYTRKIEIRFYIVYSTDREYFHLCLSFLFYFLEDLLLTGTWIAIWLVLLLYGRGLRSMAENSLHGFCCKTGATFCSVGKQQILTCLSRPRYMPRGKTHHLVGDHGDASIVPSNAKAAIPFEYTRSVLIIALMPPPSEFNEEEPNMKRYTRGALVRPARSYRTWQSSIASRGVSS